MIVPAPAPILKLEAVVKAFGGIRALDGCTLSVQPGTITGLIGPNGAGKSTLFNTIMGLYTPDSGRIVFKGTRVDGSPTWELVRKGLIKTFQIPRELGNLTVLENLLLWVRGNPGEDLWRVVFQARRVKQAEAGIRRKAEGILRFVGLFDLRDEYAKNLSGGQKKILELARALMSDPEMILLDEPVAGVNPTLTGKILAMVADLKAQGKTFFLIEHDMDVVMSRCDWIIVMHQGRKLAEGKPQEVKGDQRVVEAYLGD